MSAICGVLNLNGCPLGQEVISSMTRALAHRGPDGHGTWCGSRVSLGQRMLHTTPESLRDKQPLLRLHSGLTLVADARIDNREELRAALRIAREPAPTDGELIALAYEHWGPRCAERLIGDFAFAIWDERAQTLFCARDPMGVKPLYYVRDADRFAFASELKALLVVPGIDSTIDPEQIALFIGWHHEDRTRTVYRSLMRLPAAHILQVSPERTICQRYWTAASSRQQEDGAM